MPEHATRAGVNWRQAGGEALLIFLGVGVALFGQAWWEYRDDRRLERHLLEGIRTDLSRDSVDAARGVSAAHARAVGADRLLQFLEDPDAGVQQPVPWESPEQTLLRNDGALRAALAAYDEESFSPQEALHMVAATISIQRLDISDASFSEATASGQLSVIQDLGMRTQIADYYFTSDRYGSTVDPRAEAQWQRFRGVLAESGLSAMGSESSETILDALRADAPLLAELKNVRDYAVGQAESHGRLLTAAEELMSRLDDVLRE